jgi:hypothetical protein
VLHGSAHAAAALEDQDAHVGDPGIAGREAARGGAQAGKRGAEQGAAERLLRVARRMPVHARPALGDEHPEAPVGPGLRGGEDLEGWGTRAVHALRSRSSRPAPDVHDVHERAAHRPPVAVYDEADQTLTALPARKEGAPGRGLDGRSGRDDGFRLGSLGWHDAEVARRCGLRRATGPRGNAAGETRPRSLLVLALSAPQQPERCAEHDEGREQAGSER